MEKRKLVMSGVLRKIKTTAENRLLKFDEEWLKEEEDRRLFGVSTYERIMSDRNNDTLTNRSID